MKRMRVAGSLLTVALAVGCIFTNENLRVSATASKIDTSDLEDKKQDTLDKIKDIKSDISDTKKRISDLENSKSNLETYISKLDQEANNLAKQIDKLNKDIEAKKEEITVAAEELAEAEATAAQQYEDMKKRIQYLYENGNPSYLELFLTSESMADFLNKSSYAEQVTAYDRSMLEEYIAQKQAVKEKKKQLETEKEDLDAMADAASEQKKTVDGLIKSKTAQIQSYQDQIDSENSNAAEYKADLTKRRSCSIRLSSRSRRQRRLTPRPATATAGPPASCGPVPAAGGSPAALGTAPSPRRERQPIIRASISEHPMALRSWRRPAGV